MNIFFDLDGTLLDSRQRIYKLFSDITGQTILDFGQYWEHKRAMHSNEWLLQHCLGYDDVQIEHFRTEWFQKIELEEYLRLDAVFEPVPQLLKQLARQGFVLYIVTARQFEKLAQAQVASVGLAPYITKTFVTGGSKAKHELLRDIQLTPHDLFFGDTGLDIQTAKQLGVTSVAVLTGFRSEIALRPYNPDIIATSVWDYFATTSLAGKQ